LTPVRCWTGTSPPASFASKLLTEEARQRAPLLIETPKGEKPLVRHFLESPELGSGWLVGGSAAAGGGKPRCNAGERSGALGKCGGRLPARSRRERACLGHLGGCPRYTGRQHAAPVGLPAASRVVTCGAFGYGSGVPYGIPAARRGMVPGALGDAWGALGDAPGGVGGCSRRIEGTPSARGRIRRVT